MTRRTDDDDDAKRLSRRLGATAERLTALLEQALAEPEAGPDRVRSILLELATGMEELRVAEEELVVQAEQLAASHAAIDAERERYAALFEFAPDGYLETDELGKIVEANGAAARLLAVPASFLPGKLVHSFVAVDNRRAVRSTIVALLDGAQSEATVVVQLTPRDGQVLWAEIRVGVEHDALAERQRLRWLVRDVTARIKLEREVSELHASVELLSALANVGRLVADESDPVDTSLERLVTLAQRTLGADAAVVLREASGGMKVAARAGEAAAELADLEVSSGAWAAAAGGAGDSSVMAVGDLPTDPPLRDVAVRHGLSGLCAHPIFVGGTEAGRLSLYVRGDLALAARSVELLAEAAAASISNAEIYRQSRELVVHLTTALESRGVIDQAKGILMATQHCNADQAFEMLRRASQRENRKLRDIAIEIVARVSTRRRDADR